MQQLTSLVWCIYGKLCMVKNPSDVRFVPEKGLEKSNGFVHRNVQELDVKISVTKMCLKITHLRLQPFLPEIIALIY